MTDSTFDFDNMTQTEFEEHLPEFFANQSGPLSDDPRLTNFLAAHPDCAALVRDLESIANAAKDLFKFEDPDPELDPSEDIWARIKTRMTEEPIDPISSESGVITEPPVESGPRSVNGEPNHLVTGGSLHDLE